MLINPNFQLYDLRCDTRTHLLIVHNVMVATMVTLVSSRAV